MNTDIIKSLSKMDLIALNHQIIEELKRRDEQEAKANIDKFSIGDKVAFKPDREELTGVVIRVNRKTITIETEGFGQWRISPQFVRKISAKGHSKAKKMKNVHSLFKN